MIKPLLQTGWSPNVVLPSGVRRGAPLVIGGVPGRQDDKTGVTLAPEGESGGLFTRLLKRVGVERDALCLANCVWQKPLWEDDNERYSGAVAAWQLNLKQLIDEVQPPVIIGLGSIALEALTGWTDIHKHRGYVNWMQLRTERPSDPFQLAVEWDTEVLGIPCVCTYDPGFLIRGSLHLSGVWLRDVLAALEIGAAGWHRPALKIVPTASLEEFKQGFVQHYNPERHRLTFDIETKESGGLDEDELETELTSGSVSFEIERLSFCYDSAIGGWSVPWVNGYREEATKLLESTGPKRTWNGRQFDVPRLTRYGVKVQGRQYDVMDAWRHLHRTLPASLAFVTPFYLAIPPWKQTSHTQPEFYSAMDGICQHEVADSIERDLRTTGQYEIYERHVVDILALGEQMKINGMPFDVELGRKFERELEAKLATRIVRLQQLTPASVKGLEPKAGYKTLPAKIKAQIDAGNIRGALMKKDSKGEPKLVAYTLMQIEVEVAWEKLTKAQKADMRADMEEAPTVRLTRWTKQIDFNPGSFKQKLALIKTFGHKAKTDRKTKSETSGEETLKSLIAAHADSKKPLDAIAVEAYRAIRDCQSITKVLGTYVKGWRPGADGRIHATPGIWGDMFRLSWRKPNLAATVSDKKEVQIAAGFRRCIACAPDEVIIESDWRGMESMIVAELAGDANYKRLAGMSPHAYLASHILGRPVSLEQPDVELAAQLKAIKKSHDPHVLKVYDDAKHCVHGISYCMTKFLMAELYEMSPKRAQFLIDLFFTLFPLIKQWQQATIREAYERSRLINPWGYRMPFWDVYRWNQRRYDKLRQLWVKRQTGGAIYGATDKRWAERIAVEGGDDAAIARLSYDLGDEAKSAVSFLPRDIGAAMLKDALWTLEADHQLVSRGVIRCSIHDSIVAICARSEAPEVGKAIKAAMATPVARLNNLVIGVDQSIGQSWDKASMEEFKC